MAFNPSRYTYSYVQTYTDIYRHIPDTQHAPSDRFRSSHVIRSSLTQLLPRSDTLSRSREALLQSHLRSTPRPTSLLRLPKNPHRPTRYRGMTSDLAPSVHSTSWLLPLVPCSLPPCFSRLNRKITCHQILSHCILSVLTSSSLPLSSSKQDDRDLLQLVLVERSWSSESLSLMSG